MHLRLREEEVATVAEIPAVLPKRLPGRKYDRQFFFGITILLLAVVAIGFAPTYYLAGGLRAPLPSKVVHVHAVIFTTWMLLLLVQTGLISARQVRWHRTLGMAGFVLACAMVVSVVLTGADLAARAKGNPNGEAVLGLLSITFTDAFDFAVLAGFAFALRTNAAAHKRPSSSQPRALRARRSIAGTSQFCSTSSMQPTLRRMSFSSCWQCMTCGQRNGSTARRYGVAPS
jgi:hypothetical protein